ncbi:hypothetical protein 12VC501_gene0052 [Vibrio phage 12VC501]|nr:hypothetical protein 12VC501_gene0052 [Vibrio phage 12VC501]
MIKFIRNNPMFIIFTLVCICIGSYFTYKCYEIIKADLILYKQEGQCISNLIKQGVERKDIKASNGGCTVIKYTNAREQ